MSLACPKCGLSYPKQAEHCALDGERLVGLLEDPLIGRTVDRYRILEALGSGGMAQVYRARHTERDEDCALKVLFGHYAADRNVTRRFKREAQAATKIAHPNVVTVLEFGTSPDGVAYLAMELLTGPTVSKLVRSEGALTPARTLAVARDVVRGLEAAHAQGFVHRDLKANNVILCPEPGGGERARILDFGLVGVIGPEGGDITRLTQTGELFGTPQYMAPEQISGQPAQAQTDFYALGILIYLMLTGTTPFVGTTPHLFAQHLANPPPPLSTPGFDRLVRQLLEKDLARRPARAADILSALDAIAAANPPASAKPELALGPPVLGTVSTTRRLPPRRRWAAQAAPWILSVASLGVATLYALTRKGPAAQPPITPPSTTVTAQPTAALSSPPPTPMPPPSAPTTTPLPALSAPPTRSPASAAPNASLAPAARAHATAAHRERFRTLDQRLRTTLALRGLSFADLGATLPDDAAMWSAWAGGAEPDPAKLEASFEILNRTSAQLAIDRPLLERKLERALHALESNPDARRGPTVGELEKRYRELRSALDREPPAALAARISAFEHAATAAPERSR
jgi:serine/threonine-protein kinase